MWLSREAAGGQAGRAGCRRQQRARQPQWRSPSTGSWQRVAAMWQA